MSQEQRLARSAAIAGTLERIGAPPEGVAELPKDCIFLTSIESKSAGRKGGVTMQVGKRNAAVLLVDGTHREATDAEIEQYYADEAEKKRAAIEAANRAEGLAVVYLEPAKPNTKK